MGLRAATASPLPSDLPEGVRIVPLAPKADDRGVFTEVFRASWDTGIAPVQWNAVRSEPEVLRGVHVHVRHDDYLLLLQGRASIGLRDLRASSPTRDQVALVELRGDRPAAIAIPHGVAHGFYFHEPSLHLYAVSDYWDPEDELACHWRDPELRIPWPIEKARLSERDATSPRLRGLMSTLRERGL